MLIHGSLLLVSCHCFSIHCLSKFVAWMKCNVIRVCLFHCEHTRIPLRFIQATYWFITLCSRKDAKYAKELNVLFDELHALCSSSQALQTITITGNSKASCRPASIVSCVISNECERSPNVSIIARIKHLASEQKLYSIFTLIPIIHNDQQWYAFFHTAINSLTYTRT